MKQRMSITAVDSSNTNSAQETLEEAKKSLSLGVNQIDSDVFDPEAKLSISQPDVHGAKLKTTSLNSRVSEERVQSPQRLVQNCGPDCMMSQRIVDKLLTRMARLENERSELLAANRSWAVQYNLMKEKYAEQITRLKEDVKVLKSDKQGKNSQENEEKRRERMISSSIPSDVQNQINMLTHQAEVYKEDFLEERKARTKAHAKLEELKSELKREKKSRARVMSLLQHQNQQHSTCEKVAPLVG